MYFISMTNIKTGSQHCVNIILCLNQNAAVFYSTVKCETDLHLIAEDRLLTTKKISNDKSNKKMHMLICFINSLESESMRLYYNC